ncbi:MAG: ABC transporter substrate-binding protein [Chloroflexi bacterium]|nr:ABC transporter substrate-binding protein [Chloroflexota bacterium]
MNHVYKVCTPLVALALFAMACGTSTPATAPTQAAAAAPTVAAAAPTVAAGAATGASTAVAAAGTAAPTVAAAAAGAGGATLNIYLYQKPKNWNPLAPPNGPDTQVETMIYDTLLMVNDTYAYEPRLAQTWTASPDAKTFTFNLRPGLKWSDGEPFSSKDVLFTYKMLANPASGSAYATKFDHVMGIADYRSGATQDVAGFRTPDDNTFVVELDQANAAFISSISWPFFGVLPEHILGSADVKTFSDNPFFLNPTVGMGPFSFVQYQTDQFVELKKNPNYRAPVGIDHVFLKPVSSDVATAQLEKGEMQLVQISPTDLDRLKADPGVKIDSKPGPGIILMAAAVDQPLLQDKRVRQAMLYAIDRANIVSQVLAGQASITNTHVMGPPDAIPSDLNQYEYNPDKARQLLQNAGWDPSRVVKIQWIPGIRDRDATVQIVQAQLQAVGMQIELNPLEAGPLVDNMKNRTFDLSLYGGGLYTIDGDSTSVPNECSQAYPAGGNNAHYCNPDVDAAFAAGRATTDPAARNQAYQKVARITNDEVPYIWLYVPAAVWAYSDKLQNFKAHGELTYGFWNSAEWTLAQ